MTREEIINGLNGAIDLLEQEPNIGHWIEEKDGYGIDTNKSLCDSCTNNGCILQSGIIRNHCDFYKTESEE